MPESKFKIIDLFAGAGGLTLGFTMAGFEPILGIERETAFAETYAANFGRHCIAGDVEAFAGDCSPSITADVVIGGPPCQGFSNLTQNQPDDPRRQLWRSFLRVADRVKAKVFVVENVPNLLTAREGHSLIKAARRLGYELTDDSVGVLLASDFGVPQNRRRAFLIGSRIGPISLPVPGPGTPRVSVRRAFLEGLHPGDRAITGNPTLDFRQSRPVSGRDLHIGRRPTELSQRRYRLIPPGGNRFDLQERAPELTPDCWKRKTKGGTDIFGRLHWDEPARCTIRTEFFKPEKGRYLHPEEDRPITHWEAARLQSFPDDHRWHGTRIEIAAQIGNAVPPLLAKAVAEAVANGLRANGVRPVRRPRKGDVGRFMPTR